jgi:hypothetical protein
LKTKHKERSMKKMSTLAELDAKMIKIAASVNMTVDQFRKLSPKKFIAICNQYNATLKTK